MAVILKLEALGIKVENGRHAIQIQVTSSLFMCVRR